MSTLKRLISDERGMETVEWAVLAALIVSALVVIILSLGTNIQNKFAQLRDSTK